MHIEEILQLNENNIENVLEILSIPINNFFSQSFVTINNEILEVNDINKIANIFKKDKHLVISIDSKLVMVLKKDNYIIKERIDEKNYKIVIAKEDYFNKNYNYIN